MPGISEEGNQLICSKEHNKRTTMSSVYMSRLFQKSNSSFLLTTNTALTSKIVPLNSKTFLLDVGVGPPRITTHSELIPTNNRVGYLTPSNKSPPIRTQFLERCFVDLVTGDPRSRSRASSRFVQMLGQNDVGDGLLLPRMFRNKRVLTELGNAWKRNAKVKGFVAEKVRGGYSIAIAGYLAFFNIKSLVNRRGMGDRFVIEKFNPKTLDIVVTKA